MASFPSDKNSKYYRVIFCKTYNTPSGKEKKRKTFYFSKDEYTKEEVNKWKKEKELAFNFGDWSPWTNDFKKRLWEKYPSDEIWKRIPGYNGDYEVSYKGRVRSWKSGGVPTLLKQTMSSTGYLYVNLSKNNNMKQSTIHRLVALAFHGPPPKGKHYALHKDDVKTNNNPENIYWGNHKENIRDMALNNLPSVIKLTKEECIEISNRYNKNVKDILVKEFDLTYKELDRVLNTGALLRLYNKYNS